MIMSLYKSDHVTVQKRIVIQQKDRKNIIYGL
jgi:hypothetical protein